MSDIGVLARRRPVGPATAGLFRMADPEGLGRLAGSAGGRGQRLLSLGKGLLYDPVTGRSFVPPEYTEAMKAEHQRNLELVQARGDIRQQLAEQAAGRMPESTARQVAEKQVEAQRGAQLLTDYQEAVQEGEQVLEPIAGVPAAAARRMGAPAVAAIYERMTDTPAAINLRSRIADYVGPYRHARFGATLTGSEQAEWQKVDPLATNISHDESMRRLANIQSWYSQHAEGMAGGRSAPGGGAPQTFDQMPERPEGVTDEEWAAWIAEQGM